MNPPKIITSPANQAVKRLRSLAQRKYREEEGLFLLEGARDIAGAVAAGWALDILAHDPERAIDPALPAAAREEMHVTPDILRKITGRDNAQSAVAALRIPAHDLTAVTGRLWVALENIRDPGNLGTIIRTADAVAADGVILIGTCCDAYAQETIRASMGSFARVKTIRAAASDFAAFAPQWRAEHTGRIAGTHLHADAVDYRGGDYTLPLIVMMGGESGGLSTPMVDLCDQIIKIPMCGGTESLNLAVSTALMLYEIRRGVL